MTDDELRIKVYNRNGEPATAECPTCGEIVVVNDHDCSEEPAFDGECAMCGERYESYTTHLTECEAGRK